MAKGGSMRRYKFLMCALAVELGGCLGAAPPAPAAGISYETYDGAIVRMANTCVLSKDDVKPKPQARKEEFATALIAALLPTLVDKGIDFVADWLKKRKDELTGSYSAATHITWEPTQPAIGCLMIASGTFLGNKDKQPENQGDTKWTVETLKEHRLAAPPKFYFEAWIHYIDNPADKHVALTPAFFEFRSISGAKRISRDNYKDILVTVKLTPASTGSGTTAKSQGDQSATPPNSGGAESNASPTVTTSPTARTGQPAARGSGGGQTQAPQSKPDTGSETVQKPSPPKQDGAAPDGSGSAAMVTQGTDSLSFAVAFPKTKPGTRLDGEFLKNLRTPAGALNKSTSAGLANIEVTVLETEEGGDLLLAASAFISENKEKISPHVQAALRKLLGLPEPADKK